MMMPRRRLFLSRRSPFLRDGYNNSHAVVLAASVLSSSCVVHNNIIYLFCKNIRHNCTWIHLKTSIKISTLYCYFLRFLWHHWITKTNIEKHKILYILNAIILSSAECNGQNTLHGLVKVIVFLLRTRCKRVSVRNRETFSFKNNNMLHFVPE